MDPVTDELNNETNEKKRSGGGSTDSRGFKMIVARLAHALTKGQFRALFNSKPAAPRPAPQNAPTLDR